MTNFSGMKLYRGRKYLQNGVLRMKSHPKFNVESSKRRKERRKRRREKDEGIKFSKNKFLSSS